MGARYRPSIGMPVLAYMRARHAASTRAAAHASARPSFQVIAGATGASADRHTKVGNWPVRPIAATSPRLPPAPCKLSPRVHIALDTACKQADGACSACCGSEHEVGKFAAASPMTAPSSPTAATLIAEVPRSMPRVIGCFCGASDMSAQLRRDLVGSYQGTIDVLIGMGE